jgi:hypothetical protein
MNPEKQPLQESELPQPTVSITDIPPQYRGMAAEALQEIWADPSNITIRIDDTPDSRRKEIERRTKIVEELRRLESKFEHAAASEKESTPEELPEAEKEKLMDEIKETRKSIYFSKRNRLSDEMFTVSHGLLEKEDGTEEVFEKVNGTVGKAFDAHGIDKGNQLESLLSLLSGGIDPNRTFFSAPFELDAEVKKALGAALGTSGGTAYKAGLAVLTSGPEQTLIENGIKHVFINDVYRALVEPLAKLYPQYSFHRLSEQKAVLEEDFAKSKHQKS